MTDKIIALVTCASRVEARRIARVLVESRLAACVNVIGAPVESIYTWQGKVETAREFLLLIKTSRKRFAAIESRVRRMHSYDLPEIVAVPIERGSQPYLAWISKTTKRAKAHA
ncbi:MAG: divalent-cation tolerance protein CutA [Acidobacteriota bacterium]|nr:divalent-cation tolerance protein CutA [Acidobacteriota bacterium]